MKKCNWKWMIVACIMVNTLKAQNAWEKCGFDAAMQRYKTLHPEFVTNSLHSTVPKSNLSSVNAVQVTIPVVVHVLFNNDEENVSDEVIYSQIEVLNQDYSYSNADKQFIPIPFQQFAGTSGISFCLASTAPDGSPTNGIIRKFTELEEFGTDDQMKFDASGGSNVWNATQYLNIWVCDIASGVLGYTYQPGVNANVDGVAIDYKHFGVNGTFGGNYNAGRTTTHEIGHWLGLFHPWGNSGSNFGCIEDDEVEDTPRSQGPNYNCQLFPNNVSPECGNEPYGDMFMNFMDYSYDNCLYFFTKGQVTRMHDALLSFRNQLGAAEGCIVGINSPDALVTPLMFPIPADDFLNLQLPKACTGILQSAQGKHISSFQFSEGTQSFPTQDLPDGIYLLRFDTQHARSLRFSVQH